MLALIVCPPFAWVTALVAAQAIDVGPLLAWLAGVPLAAAAATFVIARRQPDRARLAAASLLVTAGVPILLYVLFFVALGALID